MKFTFDLQRFDEVSIVAGDTYTLDGVTYTALEDARLNLGDDGKVSGLASGSVTATVTGQSNPTVTFDAADGAINFTATGDGKVITVTRLFPIEFIDGEFTYVGNKLQIGVDATLAIVNNRYGAYSLRNENTFEYGGTYTFSNTAITTESQHTFGTFTLTNGTDVRQLHPEAFGTVINRFAERGFTLTKGSSEVLHIGGYTLTATATDDAALNISLGANGASLVPATGDGTLNVVITRGDTPVLAGELECTSGSITLGYDNKVTFAKDTSFNLTYGDYALTVTTTDEASIGVALQDNKLVFTPGQNDGGLNLLLTRGGTPVFGGELNVSDGTITFDAATQKFTFSEGTNVSIALGSDKSRQIGLQVTGGDASFKTEADGAGNFIITPDDGDGSLDVTIKRGDQITFASNVSISGGSIVLNNMGQTVGLTAGTTVNITLGNHTFAVKTTDDASFMLGITSDGSISVTPNEGDGSLDIAISRGGTQIFQNTVSVSGGTITFNPATRAVTLTDGTTISLSFGAYELTAKANGNATSALSLTGNGIAITPNTGDGSLDITLSGAGGSMNANIEVLSGSFILSEGGKITVTKDTELQIDFGNGYIINFKATDDAGGSLVLGADGITFVPGSDDGGLVLSVTRDGVTRTASLDVTGSVTYKLDGSISLAKGTVVRNVFEDGRILTITANTDASGSIAFTPDGGLTITPATPDALILSVTTASGLNGNFNEITGTVTYKGGSLILADGTSFVGTYDAAASTGGTTFKSEGGDGIIIPTDDGFAIISEDGAKVSVVNERNNGCFVNDGKATFYLTTLQYSISEGSNVEISTPRFPTVLETAGNYTLNGMKITTTKDNTEVQLSNYDTITFAANAGIVFDGQKFSGDSLITLTNGAIAIVNTEDGVAVNGTALNDNIINSGDNVTLTGGKGDDRISLDSAANNLIRYASGDGDDSIYGFGNDDTISISGAAYSTATSGNDLVLNVGSDYVTLFGAASLDNPHIIIGTAGGGSDTTPSTQSGGGSSSTTSGGGSSSTTSGGGSSSTTSGGSSSSTTSGGGSSSTTSGGSSSSTTSGGSSSSTTSGGSSSSSNRTYYGNGNSNSFTFRQNSHSTTADAPTTATTSTETELPSLITQSNNSTSTQRVYTGGDQVITNYTAGEKITLGTSPTGGAFVNGNFILSSASGNLVVQNAAGKVIDFIDGNGNDYIKAYEATAAGVVDGRGLGGFELINGSAGNDWIYAGDGGSSLWGGSGNVSDMLVGGAGTDIFVGGKYQGADVISNAETKDIINISDATLSDIIATAENNGLIAVTFNNGNAVAVQSSEALSAAFQLADGSAYRYNHATKGWQSA